MAGADALATAEQRALDERIDAILAAHGGDFRAAIEVLLMVNDARAETIAWGYIRGRMPGARAIGDG